MHWIVATMMSFQYLQHKLTQLEGQIKYIWLAPFISEMGHNLKKVLGHLLPLKYNTFTRFGPLSFVPTNFWLYLLFNVSKIPSSTLSIEFCVHLITAVYVQYSLIHRLWYFHPCIQVIITNSLYPSHRLRALHTPHDLCMHHINYYLIGPDFCSGP